MPRVRLTSAWCVPREVDTFINRLFLVFMHLLRLYNRANRLCLVVSRGVNSLPLRLQPFQEYTGRAQDTQVAHASQQWRQARREARTAVARSKEAKKT